MSICLFVCLYFIFCRLFCIQFQLRQNNKKANLIESVASYVHPRLHWTIIGQNNIEKKTFSNCLSAHVSFNVTIIEDGPTSCCCLPCNVLSLPVTNYVIYLMYSLKIAKYFVLKLVLKLDFKELYGTINICSL